MSDDQLRPLAQKIDGLGGTVQRLLASLKSKTLDPGAITGAAGAVDALGSQAGGLGAHIKDLATPSLGG